jgi:putative MFS transporter
MASAAPALDTDRITGLHLIAAAACAVALAVDMIEITIGNALSAVFSAPPYSMDAGELSWLLAAVYLGAVIGAPLIGWASERRGIRFCLAASLLWLGVISFLAAASNVNDQLTVLRFLSGLSLGAIPPLMIAFLTQIAPPRYRGVLIFWVCGIAALAPPLALLVMRWLTPLRPLDVEGWRWLLAFAGVLSFAASWIFFVLPQGSLPVSQRRVGVSATMKTAFATHGQRFSFVAMIYFLLPWASVGFPLMAGPILLLRGYNLSEALLYVTVITVGPTVGSLITGLFVDRIERRVALFGCAAIMAISVMTFWLTSSAPWLAGALGIFGVATAIYVTVLTLYAAEISPTGVRTFLTSTAWAINRGASAIAPVVLLPLIARHSAFSAMVPICAALLGSMLLLAMFGPNGAAGRAVD